ncbi:MAG: response regulator [Gammaproteobacteria bacterium]
MSDKHVTVLVADDDPVILPFLNELLSRHYHVIAVSDGADAWDILNSNEHSIDVVLTDVKMPKMGGIELLTNIKRDFPNIGVIMISGSADTETAISAMRQGAYDYVVKPFKGTDELLFIIKRWLYQQSLEAKLLRYAELHREMMKNMKIRTFMALDVSGSKVLKKGEDPFLVQYSFSAYQKFLNSHVEGAGGLIHNTSGDGTMACFNAATAAMAAATNIISSLEVFNKRENRLQDPFKLRIGMHTGPVILDDSGRVSEMFSETLDIAAHVQKQATAGVLSMTSTTLESLNNSDEFIATNRIIDGYPIFEFSG